VEAALKVMLLLPGALLVVLGVVVYRSDQELAHPYGTMTVAIGTITLLAGLMFWRPSRRPTPRQR
jgi:hypothetical protein